ncbi:UNVERIFIED_CONTAM: hypothetical protein GTU68_059598 [Idotea baltica]|nr:hypothetical protein [Idotea baltica]
MEITEVRIKLMENDQDRLLGFCSITIDAAFVVRDLKIIQGTRGPFIAMPSRKLSDRCPSCSSKNHLRSAYCGSCGNPLSEDRSVKTPDGKAKLYADIAHPINSQCRDLIQESVIAAYEQELIDAKRPGYVCRYDDFGENDFPSQQDSETHRPAPAKQVRLDVANNGHEPGPHNSSRNTQPIRADDHFGEGLFQS